MGPSPWQTEREMSLSSFIKGDTGYERRNGPVYARGTDYAMTFLAQVADIHTLPLRLEIMTAAWNCSAQVPRFIQNCQGMKEWGEVQEWTRNLQEAMNRKDCQSK